MASLKFRPKTASLTLAVILVVGAAGFWAFGSSQKNTQSAEQGQSSPQVIEPADIETEDFKYQKPSGWAKLSQEVLDSNQANSGIGRVAPTATFTTRVSSSTPGSDDELKNSTIEELKKLTKFELLSSGNTDIDGKGGQKFSYRIGDANKVKQELSVVVYKQKTFFLLFSATDLDFDKQKTDFDKILSGFKFK